MSDISKTVFEAAAFRRLLEHLNLDRTDVQNVDLMIIAGFSRDSLAEWYREAAAERGTNLSEDEALDHIYGEPCAQWKGKYEKDTTDEQLFALAIAQSKHGL